MFTYLYTYFYYKELWVILSNIYVITIPVNLMSFPVFYFYLYTIIQGTDITAKKRLPHLLPALIVLLLMLPFMYIGSETRNDFVQLKLLNDHSNPLLEYIRYVQNVVMFGVVNLQCLFYFVLIMKNLSGKKVRRTKLYSKTVLTERILLSMLFFTLLMVLINYSYYLGVLSTLSSSIFFNFVSTLIMVFLFIWGFYQKPMSGKIISMPQKEK